MSQIDVIPSDPITLPRTLRVDRGRFATSGKAGKIIPLMFAPILREESILRGGVSYTVEMAETPALLMNAVNVTSHVWFWPFLAAERFNGMDSFNRSYSGLPETEGGSVIPFFEREEIDTSKEFWRTMGIHPEADGKVNMAPLEAYNSIINYRRKARTKALAMRERLANALAAAFWHHTQFAGLVPNYDEAMIDGALKVDVTGFAPVRGIGLATNAQGVANAGYNIRMGYYRDASGEIVNSPQMTSVSSEHANLVADVRPMSNEVDIPRIFADLAEAGIEITLSGIEQAKQVRAMAIIRQRFDGLDDDHIIDLLMQGVRVPDQQLSQPILLDRQTTILGYNRRFSTTAGALDQSVTTGLSRIDHRFRLPPVNTGGIVMVMVECVPEQLFERSSDIFMRIEDPNALPNPVRDILDPRKVDVLTKDLLDVRHSEADQILGYRGLNSEWQRSRAQIGGKFYRPDPDAGFDEDRQRMWVVEQIDPQLNRDFYLASNLTQSVFADQLADGFEFIGHSEIQIVGNMVFGKGLHEDSDAFEKLQQLSGQLPMNPPSPPDLA